MDLTRQDLSVSLPSSSSRCFSPSPSDPGESLTRLRGTESIPLLGRTNEDFSNVYKHDASILRLTNASVNGAQRWISVFAGFVYFAFLVLQEEAIGSYWSAISRATRRERSGRAGRMLKILSLFIVLASYDLRADHLCTHRSPPPSSYALPRLPNLGNSVGPVSPSNPISQIARKRISRRRALLDGGQLGRGGDAGAWEEEI